MNQDLLNTCDLSVLRSGSRAAPSGLLMYRMLHRLDSLKCICPDLPSSAVPTCIMSLPGGSGGMSYNIGILGGSSRGPMIQGIPSSSCTRGHQGHAWCLHLGMSTLFCPCLRPIAVAANPLGLHLSQ